MAKLIQLPNARPVNPAETQVVQVLLDSLPNTYTQRRDRLAWWATVRV